MHSQQELVSQLSPEDIAATLKVCELPHKDEYTEDEVYRFQECRALIEQGSTYDEVAQLFAETGFNPAPQTQPLESDSPTKAKKPKAKKSGKSPNTPELEASDDQEALFATVNTLTEQKAKDIKTAIAKSTVELEAEMVEVSNRMLLQRLHEMATSGEIEEAIDQERQRLLGKPEARSFNLMDRYQKWRAERPQLKSADVPHQHLLPESQE